METGVLERIRALEADIEKHIDSVVQQELFRGEVTNERHRVLLDHFKLSEVEKVRLLTEKLLDAYLDEDDIVQAQEAPDEGNEVIAAALRDFEAKVADLREYHHAYRDVPPIKNDLVQPDPKQLDSIFGVRERYGTCLDLERHYNSYSTFMISTGALAASVREVGASQESSLLLSSELARWAPGWEGRLEYFRFVPELPHLLTQGIHANRKLFGFRAYKRFVSEMLDYVVDFYTRLHPLQQDMSRLLDETEANADEFWAALSNEKTHITAAPVKRSGERRAGGGAHEEAEVSDGDDEEEEATLRASRLLPGAKVSCGLVIPPSLKRYVKTFSMWSITYTEELLQRASNAASTSSSPDKTAENLPGSLVEVKEVCVVEAKITAILQSLLFETLQHTEQTLLRDYSKTAEELEQDRQRAEEAFVESLEKVKKNSANTMEGTVANAAQYHMKAATQKAKEAPKDLVEEVMEKEQFIGEDGRPIARWLVQLQQLDKNFVCEVCGGTVYKGPKVFREHFGAERHAEGLRRLGITQNLKEYEGVASIRAAIELRDRLRAVPGDFRRRLREDQENEEMQDAQGKVVTTKDYMRFQRRRM